MKSIALITGGSRGIGYGIAIELAANDFDLAINGTRSPDQVEDVMQKLKGFGNDVIYCRGNISSATDRENILRQVREHYGKLHVLVNNAGVAPKERRDILDATEESFDDVISTNLKGPYFLTQKAANWMIEQKKNDPEFTGCIINISSISATVASVNRGEYCISKAGVSMMTALFALRLAPHRIMVNEIRPGVIRTEMTAPVKESYDREIAGGLSPIARWGEGEDIGRAVAALASGAFPFTTGEAVHVDGGLHIGRM